LRVEDPGVSRWLRGADVPHGGSDQKRQAANHRVDRQGDPGRGRHHERSGRGNDTNLRGYDNHSCKHVPQPPREEHLQRASVAWQDCGRALVNLRQVESWMRRCGAATVWEKPRLTLASKPVIVNQSGVAISAGSSKIGGNPLKKRNLVSGPCGRNRSEPSMKARVGIRHGRGAARLRWPCARDWLRNPDVTEECLSFVMPQQQSARVLACGYGS
jgi:hypothetical protein